MAHNTEIKACVDRGRVRSARDGRIAPAMAPALPTPIPSHAVLLFAKKWPNDSVLRVHFMDGDPEVQAKVKDVAYTWSELSNIRLKFVDDPSAEIRITFTQPGSWSYIGTDARAIPKSQATMNFGWLTPNSSDSEYERVVLHEFGHALGLIHEHQNPEGEIPWNKEAVYEYYGGPPNNWSKEQVDVNLFQKYAHDEVRGTEFDDKSIMLYPIPNEFTHGDFEVGWNRQLSATDMEFIHDIYPKPAHEILIDAPAREGTIGERGEIDTYTINVFRPGRYVLETSGRTDLVMSLYGPEDDAIFIAEDDDSGRRLNPRIVADLEWGRYTIRLRHFSTQRTGDYTIGVRSEGTTAS
jgi:hypothetical protein